MNRILVPYMGSLHSNLRISTPYFTAHDIFLFSRRTIKIIVHYFCLTQPYTLFIFRYKASVTLPMLSTGYDKIKDYDFGVCHADDLFLLFKPRILSERVNLSEKDEKMVKKMIEIWTSFATNGQPSSQPDWLPLTKEKHQWAVLNSQPLKMQFDQDFEQKVEFIRSMFEVLSGYRHMNFEVIR